MTPNSLSEDSSGDGRLNSLLALLADGRFHSGDAIGQAAGVSRAAIWKLIEQLRELGVPVEAVRGRGYRLPKPVELLDSKLILEELTSVYPGEIGLGVKLHCDSTNRILLERAKAGANNQLLATELQSAGRGRWGRHWFAPFGTTLALSLLWRFPVLPHGLSGLSLAIAIGVAEVLDGVGAPVRLKWPNDLLLQGRKLGGILIELYGEVEGPCAVVIGVGLNLDNAQGIEVEAEQPVAALSEAIGEHAGERNKLLAQISAAMAHVCDQFTEYGFQAFLPRWKPFDALYGKPVVLALPTEEIRGIARGVDSQGALLLERNGKIETRYSGDLRLRLRRDPAA